MYNTIVSYLYLARSAQTQSLTQTFSNKTSVTLTHNLGYYPIIQILDNSLEVVDGEVEHINTSVAVVTFAVSQSGTILYQ